MRTILNIVWLILCGWWMAILYALAGIVCFILVITIPFGIAAFRIARYILWPFGRTIEKRRDASVASLIGNVIWIALFGWWLAIGHLVTGVSLCLTIIGIPLGLANFKLIPITLVPLGVRIVPTSIYGALAPVDRAISPGATAVDLRGLPLAESAAARPTNRALRPRSSRRAGEDDHGGCGSDQQRVRTVPHPA